ncbi:MAG: NADH-quinone oxidoreductase subunit M [Candidatus Eiseniibacteriota bacterium]|jgi:NADH-quinone oxidoreductase subunit M
MDAHLLTLITFIPVLGMVVVLLMPNGQERLIKIISAVFTAVPLALSIRLLRLYDPSTAAFQFQEHHAWIPSFSIEYFMGVDGMSVVMIVLTTLLSFLCIFASWKISKAVKGYFSLFLLLETGMLGVFVSLDFVLFYLFWEVMLLPMYFLIGIWGGPRREYAAIKFFLYTLAGSVLMLLAILALYFHADPHTFNMVTLMENPGPYGYWFRTLVWFGLFIGFAIKVPSFPFHTWLPDAHVEAPTAISVILAGVLLKLGTYGMLRINFSMLPEATRSLVGVIAVLAVINIIYGALCAMAQKDMKKLVAYSSISHMGFVMLGLAALNEAGFNGAVLQMFNHGTITGMLFLIVGVIYDRAHHREIDGFGGLMVRMPIYAGITSLAFFASLGLPGLSGFWGEVMVLLGAFTVYKGFTIAATLGIVLGAAYLLWTLQRMFLGPLNEKYANLPEISGREIFTLAPLGAIVILLGIYPTWMIDVFRESLAGILAFVS